MKATTPVTTRSVPFISADTLALTLFLSLASLLAVVGGGATSVLFFGLLLTFAGTLYGVRRTEMAKAKVRAGGSR